MLLKSIEDEDMEWDITITNIVGTPVEEDHLFEVDPVFGTGG
jgi:hypothetical protein